ncbi:MAG: hypothetical protein IJR26_08395 [Bacteroidales bacterium]|nr:hypothetical protein [Bacteroidales bacterium]
MTAETRNRVTFYIDGFNTLLIQGYMAHPDDFNSPEMQRQVRATTYLMSVVRRQFADKVQEKMGG